jgi:hypothetical protein
VPGIDEMVVAGKAMKRRPGGLFRHITGGAPTRQGNLSTHTTIGAGDGTHCVGGANDPPQANRCQVR